MGTEEIENLPAAETESEPPEATDLGNEEAEEALTTFDRALGEVKGTVEKPTFAEKMTELRAGVSKNLAYGVLIGYGGLTLIALIYCMVRPTEGPEALKLILSTLTPLVGVVLGFYFTKK